MVLPERTNLFKSEPGGITYRIPALLYVNNTSTFLAFAERRRSAEDMDAECLVMRRGLYKNGYIEWEGCQRLDHTTIQGFRTLNPCPVFEEINQVLFLFFNCIKEGVSEGRQRRCGNQTKLCYIESKDCGISWSPCKDLTEAVANTFPKLATFSVGPGHGIQMLSGALIVPAYAYVAKCLCLCVFPCYATARSFYLYSEDRGQTWRASEGIRKYETLECQVAEVVGEDDKSVLYCNARTTGSKRVEAMCFKVGGDFKSVEKSKKLNETRSGCGGSTISFLGLEKLGQDSLHWLLFSHPSKRGRHDLGIYLNTSPDQSKSWSKPWVIYKGPSASSDLAHCKGSDIFAILLECGEKTAYEGIDFCLFTLQDVLENIRKKKSFFAKFRK
ncbi:sialidase-3-like [Ambystoma mexicanum]|uniref:sialidase-3-like n=1 Tax=Ambystoma mexicanum TaxID=8296 RepID=UPI0037E91EBB